MKNGKNGGCKVKLIKKNIFLLFFAFCQRVMIRKLVRAVHKMLSNFLAVVKQVLKEARNIRRWDFVLAFLATEIVACR